MLQVGYKALVIQIQCVLEFYLQTRGCDKQCFIICLKIMKRLDDINCT